ncbi:gamma-glutamyltransferase [Sphingobacterium sp. N143]|uniref:gamma-glutamyltransferase n=1 Tax=Sphingobacterium sp. N143 TaxID=2746727 RepID=UPI0025779429|nr:gamma-glutamyltransferase [Sphingobacterium sp. N143]MDM1295489.1 gamma-glutamyltransferase [Sphingobacterium sp. N143]
MNKLLIYCLMTGLLFASCSTKQRQLNSADQPSTFNKAAVVTAHPLASAVGVKILKRGGNAIDAAVAVQFALAVVYPNAGNIGGGGFMLYRNHKGEYNALDFREKAPLKASRDMYLDSHGNVIPDLSLYSQLASGIPGSVAGMWEAHQKYGKLPWKELVVPAIELARKGFKISQRQANEFESHKERFVKLNPSGAAIIKDTPWQPSDLFIQEELAHTLERIATDGRDGFYKGKTADLIVAEMNKGKGIIQNQDLTDYRALWRTPINSTYRGYKVISMPPPSSGGTSLLALLKSVEQFPLQRWGFQSDSTVRVIVEAERHVYANRAKYLGDPDFVKIPVQSLIDSSANASKLNPFNFHKATLSKDVQADVIPGYESEQTTHFNIVDEEGNAVSITTTLNDSYGSGVIVDGAGFLLNNEMDDFSVKTGVPNMYGLTGEKANEIQPGKRMLSSMTPTILEKNNKLFMIVGTPGGSTIITSVFQAILNVIDFGQNAQSAVSSPRFHHQWLPDRIDVEKDAISPLLRDKLTKDGYIIHPRGTIGRVENILILPNGKIQTGADPRGDDTAKGY